jgi:hypothetical protein
VGKKGSETMTWRSLCGLAVSLALGLVVVVGVAGAHERRQVGGYVMRVGWADEPTYAGVKNGVQLLLSDASGKPVTDLPEELKVEIVFGTQKMGPLPLEAAFGKVFGRPGDFRAAVIPTRPGNYTFHFVGSLNGQRIDQSFTSSDKTFDPVTDASAIEFPAKDPSPGELAGRLERLGPRIDEGLSAAREAAAGASQARVLGILGILVGAVGILVAVSGRRRATGGPGAARN